MSDVLMSAAQGGPTYLSRSRALARIALIDVIFHNLTRLSAIAVLVILGGVIVSLIHGAQPAIDYLQHLILELLKILCTTSWIGVLANC